MIWRSLKGVTQWLIDGTTLQNIADGAERPTKQPNPQDGTVSAVLNVSRHIIEHTKNTLPHKPDESPRPGLFELISSNADFKKISLGKFQNDRDNVCGSNVNNVTHQSHSV